MTKKVSLTVFDDGPIKVSGATSIRYCGEAIGDGSGEDIFLCRCGESKNAPFCDGSHNAVGFSGANPERDKKKIHVWEGNTIRTYFNPNACMHVFYCKPLKALREAELAGDTSAAQKIADAVALCPSGALTYESKAAPIETTFEAPAEIDIQEGGEIRLRGDFEVNSELQERQPADRVTLCRCGLSRNKPYCDGRHQKRDGFR